jgi:hypothetical protein
MKIRVRLGLGFAAALGLLGLAESAWKAKAQEVFDVPAGVPIPNAYWQANRGGFKELNVAQAGEWAEVINVTPKWIVVQDEDGKQYPIASDRVRQFLIRWPSSTSQITSASMIEVTGPDVGSNVIVADHIDQFEAGAQTLVTPIVRNAYNNYGYNYNYGFNHTLSPYDLSAYQSFNTTYFMYPIGYAPPLPLHVVGRALANDPVRITGNGDNWYTIQPSTDGLSVTQVTVGNNSYARKGDLVYLVLDTISPRSLDVAQLVLYKKIPLRSFQP